MIRAKDPGSAITHFIGMLCAAIAHVNRKRLNPIFLPKTIRQTGV